MEETLIYILINRAFQITLHLKKYLILHFYNTMHFVNCTQSYKIPFIRNILTLFQ